jgi:PilZ domain-containing protein
MQRDDSGERRRDARKQVTVQAEFHFEEMTFPIRGQISELSAGGRFVETMFTKPVGSKLDVVLWFGEGKISVPCVIATSTPLVGNGIQFREMTPADRDQLTRFLENL